MSSTSGVSLATISRTKKRRQPWNVGGGGGGNVA